MILSLIVFPNRPIDQINLYTKDGFRVSSSLHNEVAEDRAFSNSGAIDIDVHLEILVADIPVKAAL